MGRKCPLTPALSRGEREGRLTLLVRLGILPSLFPVEKETIVGSMAMP